MEMFLYIATAAVIVVVIYLLVRRLHQKNINKSTKPGRVLLHLIPPTHLVPCPSPPCLKLETFLRMTKIPYENAYGLKFSKKGKLPWIIFNGKEVADSNFCIRFLMKEFRVDVDSHLNLTEKAIGHAVLTMLEENTYWSLAYYRWFSDYAATMREQLFGHLFPPLKYLVSRMVQRTVGKNLWSHGMGRHTEQEIYGIAERDLLAVSDILGHKNFLFGDKPCLADAALFAFIASSVLDCPESPFAGITKTKAKNLEDHAQRMKMLYYPDWSEIITNKIKSE